MLCAILSEMPRRNSRLKISLLTLALAALALLLPAAPAQTFSNSGSISITQGSGTTKPSVYPVSGTCTNAACINVTGLQGSYTSMSVTLTYSSTDLYQSFASPALLLVSPDGTHMLDMLSYGCGSTQAMVSGVTFTLEDSATSLFPETSICPTPFGPNYKPAYYYAGSADNFPSPGPGNSGYTTAGSNPSTNPCSGTPCPSGTGSFDSVFGGLTGGTANASGSLNGTWRLYAVDQGDDDNPTVIGSWSLTFVVTGAKTATVTTLNAGSPNPSFTASPGNTVSFTASVSPNPGSGTVTLKDTTTNTTLGTSSVNGSGVATFSGITFSTEGTHLLQATYNGATTFAASPPSSSVSQIAVNHATNPAKTTNSATFCNGPITVENDAGGSPYPSMIVLGPTNISGDTEPSLSGTIQSITVSLDGFSLQNGEDLNWLGALLQAPGSNTTDLSSSGNAFDFLSYAGNPYTSGSLTFADAADGGTAQIGFESAPTCTTCLPSDDHNSVPADPDTFPSPAPQTFAIGGPTGSATFLQEFGGLGVNGTWSLYLDNRLTDVGTLGSLTKWCLNFTTQVNAHPTTTTVTGSPNPATITVGANPATASVTLTATVTSTDGTPLSDDSNPGTVAFVDGATTLGTASVSTSGIATLTTTLGEGTHEIVATYGGIDTGTEFGVSSGSFDLRVNYGTTNPTSGSGAGPYTYCNAGGLTVPGLNNNVGAAEPYPSNIFVTNLPGTVDAVTVSMDTFKIKDQNDLMSLLVGPGNNNLDFFSLTGTKGSDTPTTINMTFSDAAGGPVTADPVTTGTYKPTSYNTTIAYPQCPTNATLCETEDVGPPLPTSIASPNLPSHRADPGQGTFADAFGGSSNSTYNGNGTWSLYLDDGGPNGGGEVTTLGSWCVNFTENQPTVSLNTSPSSPITQGEQGAEFPVSIESTGPGSTGDPVGANPMTVTYVLSPAFTYQSGSGSNWTCNASGQTVTCKNDSAVADGSYYPTLNLDVNVSSSAIYVGTVNNTISVGGAGVATTTAVNAPITIVPSPVLSVTKGHTATFTQGQTAQWYIIVANGAAPTSETSGTTTVSDTLPSGYTVANFSGTSVTWSCSGTNTQTATCTSTAGISGGNPFPTIQVVVNVPANSPTSVTNTAKAYGGGDLTHTNSGNAATGSDSNVPVVQVPASITTTAGTPQSTLVGTSFGTALQATVKDAGGVVIPNYPGVLFVAPGSGASGTFSNSTDTITTSTNSSGIASEAFTANSTPGLYGVTASLSGLTSASFSLTNNPGTATHFSVSGPSSTTAGSAFSITVTALDASNNVATGYTGTVRITSSDTGAGVTLPANFTFVSGNNGTHTFTNQVTLVTGGLRTVTATDTVNSSITGTSGTISVDQAPAFTSAASDTTTVGSSTPFTFLTTGYPTPTLSYSGTLPSGIGFTAKTGGSATLTGTPAAGTGGSYPLTITATGSTVVTQNFTLTVVPAPVFTSANSTTFEQALNGSSFTVTATGSPSPVTLAVSNIQNAVAGVNVPSSGTGSLTISGLPTASGTETFTVTATNGAGGTSTQNFTLTVAPLVEISPPYLSAGCPIFIEYSPASCTFTASGGFGWVNVDITNVQNLISGLYFSYSGESVILSGTPTATGTLYFRLTATDSLGGSFAYDYSLTVQIPQYQLITAANPAAGGTVTPVSGGFYNQGTVVPITATPATGYTFVGWTSAADPVASATSASTTIAMNGPESVTAQFAPNLVVTTNLDDPGTATNCTPQTTPGTGTDLSCSLRDALLNSASAGAGNISFSSSAFNAGTIATNTIMLTYGTLSLPANTTVTGATSGSGSGLTNLVTVNGNAASTVFTVNPSVIGVSLSGLTITNGSGSSGGGINNGGTLAVTSSTISGNNALPSGAGIYNTGSLTVAASTISGNTVPGTCIVSAAGGGIWNTGSLTVGLSTFTANSAVGCANGSGGAIASPSGSVTITGSTFSGNSADGGGGAIFFNGGTNLLASNILSGNAAPDVYGTYTNGGGNLIGVSNLNLAPLGNYGGPTQTMIPLPGSPAICQTNTEELSVGLNIPPDQRGLPLDSNCPSQFVDTGAVQTNYAFAFTTEPPSPAVVTVLLSPAPAVTLTESGAVSALATGTVTLTDAEGDLSPASTTSATLSSGTAIFSNLIPTGAETDDALFAVVPLNSSINLTAQSSSFAVNPGYQLTTAASPAAGGTVTPASGGFYTPGTNVPLVATPAAGYTFAGWSSAVDPVADSTSANTIIPMNANESVVANFAANLVVTTNQDDPGTATNCTPQTTPGTGTDLSCSLRDALAFASTAGSANITFDSTVFATAQTILLGSNGSLNLPPYTSVTGPTTGSTNLVTVSGNNLATVFLNSGWAGTALANLNITAGNAGTYQIGGGIYNEGELALSNVNFTANTANAGGGLFNDYNGLAEITNSLFSNNTATGISRGQGGAIFNNGFLLVEFSTFSGNSASGSKNAQGGAVFNDSLFEVAASTFSGNTASGTSKNAGGGAICNSNGEVEVLDSTFYGNLATGAKGTRGGAIVNHVGGLLEIANSTITGNAANQYGGGIYFENGLLEMANNIVYNNVLGTLASPTAYDDLDDTTGSTTFGSSAANLGGNSIGYYNIATATAPTPSILLAPLGNYGGPTQTMPPLPGSPAICGGTSANATEAGITIDQRGFGFVSTYCPSGSVDSGAVQTNYALAFTQSFQSAYSVSEAIYPQIPVALTESGVAATAATSSVSMSDSANVLTGTTSASLSAGLATFANLIVPVPEANDSLTASIPLNPALTPPLVLFSAPSSQFNVEAPAALTYPTPGTLGVSQLFTWQSGVGVTQYALRIGSTGIGSTNLYYGPITTNTSVTVNNLPHNGQPVYVRLFSLTGGVWLYGDYTFTAFTGAPATLTSPTTSPLGVTQLFTWNAGVGATQYALRIGSTGPGSTDLYYGPGQTTSLSATVNNLPHNGGTVYVRLLSLTGGFWLYNDYTFTAFTGTPATLSSPTTSPLGVTQNFTWLAGVGVTQYQLHIGSTGVGSSNLYNGAGTTSLSATVNNLPFNGETLYVRLLSLTGGFWLYNDYTFTAFTGTPATLNPISGGSTLSGATQVFTWNTGVRVTAYALRVGSTGPGSTDLYYGPNQTTSQSATVPHLPVNGETVYVRLFSLAGGFWLYNDYTFTAYH